MKNKVLFVFLISAFINVIVYCCLSNGVSDFALIGDTAISKNLFKDSSYHSESKNMNLDKGFWDYPDIKLGPIKRNYIGPIFGFNYTYFNNIDLPTNIYTRNLEIKDAEGIGYFAGLCLIHYFGNPRAFNSIICFELLFNKKSFNIEKSGIIKIPQIKNTRLDVPVKYGTDFSFSCINLILNYNLLLFNTNFFCGVKVGTGVVIHNKSTQFLEITSSDKNIKFMDEQNIKFKDDNRTMIINDGKVPDFNSFQLSFAPLVGYDLLVGRMFVRISGGYDFSLISLKKNSDWNYGNIFFDVGILFPFHIN